MTADELIAALDLPTAARVDRRVPKALLLEHGAPTAVDKRRINEGIERVQWVAALKPTTIGVAAYRDDAREYLEINVLHLGLREAAATGRLIELVHRAVPYPVVVVAEQGGHAIVALAHKRWSQGAAGQTVLDGGVVQAEVGETNEPHDAAFRAALALGRQARSTLYELYQSWVDALVALLAARRVGTFTLPDADRRAERLKALGACEHLDAEIARLRAAAAKEKQMPRLVELNQELKRAEVARAEALARL